MISIPAISLLCTLIAAPSISTVGELYQEGRFTEARLHLEKITPTKANAPDLLLYKGLLENDGTKAVAYLEKLLAEYPKSSHRYKARFSIAQQQFLEQSYKDALGSLRIIIKAGPESAHYAIACLWIARCYEALNDTTKAITWYERVDSESDSLSFNRAQESLSMLKRAKSIFSIQIGSFQSKESAHDLAALYAEKGYETWLATTQKENTKYYKVLIGEFDSREMAEGFLELFSQKEDITYWIVKVRRL